jgi:hypothetical protein
LDAALSFFFFSSHNLLRGYTKLSRNFTFSATWSVLPMLGLFKVSLTYESGYIHNNAFNNSTLPLSIQFKLYSLKESIDFFTTYNHFFLIEWLYSAGAI